MFVCNLSSQSEIAKLQRSWPSSKGNIGVQSAPWLATSSTVLDVVSLPLALFASGNVSVRIADQLCKEKTLVLDGYQVPDLGSASSVRPTYKDSDFKIICPSGTGCLPVRADWLEMTESKLQLQESRDALAAIIKKHNDLFNPSGKLFTVAGKRELPNPDEKKDGVLLKHNDGDPKNEAELTAQDGPLITHEVDGQKLFITKSGQVWIWGAS